jgi:Gram-negative bacterial TonB protein C-terminal
VRDAAVFGKLRRMRFLRKVWIVSLTVGIAVSAVCFAQAAPAQQTPPTEPVKIEPPPDIPGRIASPKILGVNEDVPLLQCAGVTPAKVTLQFVVTIEGDAKEIKVLESPSEKHSACAVNTVQRTKFSPATQDGKPVKIKMVLTLNIKGS